MLASKAVSTVPPSKFWDAGMPRNFGMMLNDSLGDCVPAHMYHARQVWSFNANPPEDTEPDAQVEATYEQACGYNPSNPATDQGCDMQATYTWWMNTGMPLANGTRDKLFAFIEIDPANLEDVQDAIDQCGVIGVGLNVPAYLMAGDTVPWTWGIDAGGDPTIIGGHAVAMPCYYHKPEFGLISWGSYYHMTPAFWLSFVEECYALVSLEWIEKTGITPLGLTIDQLAATMSALRV